MLILFSDALSRMESQHRDDQSILLDKMDNNKDFMASHLSQLSSAHHGALATKLSHVERNTREDVSNFARETRVGHNELIERSDKQAHELKELSRQLHQIQKENNSNLSQVVALFLGNMLKNDHQFTMVEQRFRRAEKQLLSVEEQQAGTQSQISMGFRSVFNGLDMIGAMGVKISAHVIADQAQPPTLAKSENESQQYLGRDEPPKARELIEIQAVSMVHVIQSPSRTEQTQRLNKPQNFSCCPFSRDCKHHWNQGKATNDLLQWICQHCHKSPLWFIEKCLNCEARFCRGCSLNTVAPRGRLPVHISVKQSSGLTCG